jgi:hypothetical protein
LVKVKSILPVADWSCFENIGDIADGAVDDVTDAAVDDLADDVTDAAEYGVVKGVMDDVVDCVAGVNGNFDVEVFVV